MNDSSARHGNATNATGSQAQVQYAILLFPVRAPRSLGYDHLTILIAMEDGTQPKKRWYVVQGRILSTAWRAVESKLQEPPTPMGPVAPSLVASHTKIYIPRACSGNFVSAFSNPSKYPT